MLLIVIYHILEVNAQSKRGERMSREGSLSREDDDSYHTEEDMLGYRTDVAGKLCGCHLDTPFNIMIPLEPAYQSHPIDVLNRNLALFDGAGYLSGWRFEIGGKHPLNTSFQLLPTPFKTIKEPTNNFDIIHQHIETSTPHLHSFIQFPINKLFKRANFFSSATSSNLDKRITAHQNLHPLSLLSKKPNFTMSSDKLGQSLDEILATQRATGTGRGGRGNGRRGGRASGGRNATAAPVGGVSKSKKPVKGSTKATPTGPSGGNVPSRIVVSNLPYDVTEQQIKEYFHEAKLHTKTVQLVYGPNGVSRGEANITFHRPGDAAAAVSRLNGVKVDNRALRVQLLVDAQAAAVFEEKAAKKLMDRISTTPKSQPKSAVPNKSNGKDQGAKRGGKRGSRGGSNTARPTKKTAEELDLEMADYWESGNAAGAEAGGDNNQAASGAAQPATNGDANMDDEILKQDREHLRTPNTTCFTLMSIVLLLLPHAFVSAIS
ncbi:hypothetical protein DID88_008058 [Monilinia fructigena]|uniref:RRM domain-containing protein n=1 Tax=Monilinia fructigena TaxID=38457 RepID=A0A395J454_9HELO|nr:hypothetical protein DID88_008058 [Monilinia fructigena]